MGLYEVVGGKFDEASNFLIGWAQELGGSPISVWSQEQPVSLLYKVQAPKDKIEIEVLLNLFLTVSSQIDTLWLIFMTAHFTIFGGYVYFYERAAEVTRTNALTILFAYAMFVYLNLGALLDNYSLYEAICKTIQEEKPRLPPEVGEFFQSYRVSGKRALAIVVHWGAALAVIAALINLQPTWKRLMLKTFRHGA